jgi:hypothetical protein
MSMTVEQIAAARDEAREALGKLASQLNDGIDAIEATVFQEDRDFTTAERSRRDFLRASLNETNGAISELAFVTLDRLNQSDEVKRMRADLDDVNRQIQGDLTRLKQIADFAQQAANALALLAQISEGLAGLAARL